MSEFRVVSCRLCGEPVFWAKTSKQKNMPVDAEPSPAGNFVVQNADASEPAVLRMSAAYAARYTGPKYTCHFETCPKRRRP